jgi:hypothetical protein
MSQLEVAQALFILLQRIKACADRKVLCKRILRLLGYYFDFPSGILRWGVPERLGSRLGDILSRLVLPFSRKTPPIYECD